MPEPVRFRFEAEPVPAARPRVTTRGTFYPRAHEEYAEFLRQIFQAAPQFHTEKAVAVSLKFVMPPYKKSGRDFHLKDIDNLSKLPLDSMTKATHNGKPAKEGGIHRYWADDSQIVHLTAMKRFARPGETPHTIVTIRSVEGSIEDYVDQEFEK